jgi:hypothetical protein
MAAAIEHTTIQDCGEKLLTQYAEETLRRAHNSLPPSTTTAPALTAQPRAAPPKLASNPRPLPRQHQKDEFDDVCTDQPRERLSPLKFQHKGFDL